MLHHCSWAHQKFSNYIGCEEIVQHAIDVIFSPRSNSSDSEKLSSNIDISHRRKLRNRSNFRNDSRLNLDRPRTRSCLPNSLFCNLLNCLWIRMPRHSEERLESIQEELDGEVRESWTLRDTKKIPSHGIELRCDESKDGSNSSSVGLLGGSRKDSEISFHSFTRFQEDPELALPFSGIKLCIVGKSGMILQ